MSKPQRKTYKFVVVDEAPVEDRGGSWDRARAAIEKLKESYVEEWAPAALEELDRTLTLALSHPPKSAEQLAAAYRLAHDMKGQGATFGYSMISDIGAGLCRLTYSRDAATAAEVQAMLAHVHAARAVIEQRIEDPDCEAAAKVLATLQSELRANLH